MKYSNIDIKNDYYAEVKLLVRVMNDRIDKENKKKSGMIDGMPGG